MPRARKKPSAPITAARVSGVSPATIRRMREATMAAASDPRRGHELGRLALREIQAPGSGISPIQESAGLRYAELRARWRAVTGTRPATAQAQDMSRVHGHGAAPDPARAEAIEAAMREADDVLSIAGARSRGAVDFICDRDCIIVGHDMLLDLRGGLDALARLWGLVR